MKATVMNLKKRLERKEQTVGSWITIGNTAVAEIMARAGFDWLTVDLEHSAITLEQTQELIRVIELCGVSPLVRVGHNQPNLIKRVMDAGAHGVIVPMVNTSEDAEMAVRSVKYPPLGIRGVGLARAQKYGDDFEGYRSWNQENSIVIVQIEHIEAVNNLKEILSVQGVDGFIVGPYDLSGSLGVPGQFDHPDVLRALETIQYVSRQLDSLSGLHVIQPRQEDYRNALNQNYKFIALSLDILFLGRSCRETVKSIRKRSY